MVYLDAVVASPTDHSNLYCKLPENPSQATQSYAGFIRHYMPEHQFSSIVLQHGVVTGLQRDSNNAEGSTNLLVSLSPVQRPILWVEEDGGETQRPLNGDAWETMLCSPALFNPRARHCTGVSEGMPQDRFVVIAYLIRHHERLSPPDRATLLKLGFNLPAMK